MNSKCPNCGQSFDHQDGLASKDHAESGCVLAAMLGVIIERETCPTPSDEVIEEIDTDWLWDRLGPVIDDLELHLSEIEEE